MSEFGQSIRQWRKTKGLSQLDLSLQANISSRHLSFLETGRSSPSKEMVIQLSNALEIPLNERNILLTQSGFAEAYSRRDIHQPEMKPVLAALELMLNNHAPFPAMVLDWNWNIVMANEPQQKLTQLLKNQQPDFSTSCNIMELLFDPNGYRPFIKNWDHIAYLLIQRLHREKQIHQDRHSDLIERCLSFPDIPSDWHKTNLTDNTAPMVHIDVEFEGISLKMFSTLASFGTAIDITMQELTIEQYFAVDHKTENFFKDLT